MYLTPRKKLENSYRGISEPRWFSATNHVFVSSNNLNYRKNDNPRTIAEKVFSLACVYALRSYLTCLVWHG